MTTAARFGSTDAAAAHRRMSFAQCWTSFVKMGERPFDDVELLSIGNTAARAVNAGVSIESANGWAGDVGPSMERAAG